jgi:hypothetical protein
MTTQYISGWHFYKFGGRKLLLSVEEDRVRNIIYKLPELELVGKGMTPKEAGEALLFQLEVGLNNPNEYKGKIWDYLRRVNGFGGV